jgi:hypothetical protein
METVVDTTSTFQTKLDELLQVGFLTGSRAFGTNDERSDFDVVYLITDTGKIDDILTGYDRTPSCYFSGYYVKIDDGVVNLIPVHPCEYLPWYLATVAMTSTLKLSGINDTIKRHAVFMGMVSLFKATVGQISQNEYNKLKKKI